MDYPTYAALLDVSYLNAAPKQRMPTIMNFNFLPDMGRMNGNWLWGAAISSLLDQTAAAIARQQCIRLSLAAN